MNDVSYSYKSHNYGSEKRWLETPKKYLFLGDENLKKVMKKAKKVIIIKCKLEGKGVN